jgi:hypothetical protein
MDAKFNLAAVVEAHTGKTFGTHLPQKEVIALLSEVHAHHANRSGWANPDFSHQTITRLVGDALDRALAFAAKTTPVEKRVAVAA